MNITSTPDFLLMVQIRAPNLPKTVVLFLRGEVTLSACLFSLTSDLPKFSFIPAATIPEYTAKNILSRLPPELLNKTKPSTNLRRFKYSLFTFPSLTNPIPAF